MTEPGKQEEAKPKTVEERVAMIESALGTLLEVITTQAKEIEALKKSTIKKATGLFGGKREKRAIKDTKTGTVYPSLSAVGKALYTEVENGDPADHFMWYKLQAKFPDRFATASQEEAEKAWKVEADAKQAEVDAANAKIKAEEAKAAQGKPGDKKEK